MGDVRELELQVGDSRTSRKAWSETGAPAPATTAGGTPTNGLMPQVVVNGYGHVNTAASQASGLELSQSPSQSADARYAGHVAAAAIGSGGETSLRLHRKLLFAVGGLPYQLTGNAIGFYLSVFLLEVVKINPFLVMVISFAGRAWDAITDPIIGLLVDRFHFGRFGQFRPWIACSLPLGCLSFFFLWFAPASYPRSPRDEQFMFVKLAHYMLIYLFFQTMLTCHQVPYTSMTMSVAKTQRDRDSITAFRMFFEISGLLLGAALFGLLTASSRMDQCDYRNMTANTSTSAYWPFDEDQLDRARYAYMLPAGISVIFYVVCTLCVVLGARERSQPESASASAANRREKHDAPVEEGEEARAPRQAAAVFSCSPDSFCGGLREVLSFKPYLLLMGAFMGVGIGLQIVQGNVALFVVHTYKKSGLTSTLCLMLTIVVAILAVPLWQFTIGKIGKKWTFAIGIFIILPGLVVAFFLQEGVPDWVLFIVFVVVGFGLSIAFLLPWSMLPDVIDQYYLQKGVRREAVFYSFYVFFNKFATGISFGLSQLVIGLAGYDVAACEQPASVGESLRYLVALPSSVCFLLCLLSLYFYPIDEATRARNNLMLEKRTSLDSSEISPANNDRVDGGLSRLESVPTDKPPAYTPGVPNTAYSSGPDDQLANRSHPRAPVQSETRF